LTHHVRPYTLEIIHTADQFWIFFSLGSVNFCRIWKQHKTKCKMGLVFSSSLCWCALKVWPR
jgi:hypothetical protein